MRTQIRLAERQGLLQGKHLSVLQVSAVYYAEIESQVVQRERDQQKFKYALLSTGRVPFADLFPEVLAAVEDDGADPGSDSGEVTYKFSDQPELSEEEMKAQLDELLSDADEDWTVNGGDIYG